MYEFKLFSQEAIAFPSFEDAATFCTQEYPHYILKPFGHNRAMWFLFDSRKWCKDTIRGYVAKTGEN